MSGNGGGTLCGVCTGFIVIPSFIMIMMSFSSLQSVEYGLDYNAITLTVDNRTYDSAGLYFLGLGHSFIKFPRTIQTIEFNAAHDDLLHTRTLDGLPTEAATADACWWKRRQTHRAQAQPGRQECRREDGD